MLKDTHPLARLLWFLPVLVLGMTFCHPLLSPAALAAGLLCQWVWLGGKSCQTTLKLSLPVILLMGGLNLLCNSRGETVFLYLNDLPLTLESLAYGLCAGCMAMGMAVWLMLFSKSLGRSGLLELLGGILPGTTMILTILLRFLPLYRRRMESRMETQRTLYPPEEGLSGRLREGGRLLSGQFSASLEQSITTADSMTGRGYGVGRRPTRFPPRRFGKGDGALTAVSLLLTLLAVWGAAQGALDCRFFPEIVWGSSFPWFWVGGGGYLALLLLPTFWQGGRQLRLALARKKLSHWKEKSPRELL